MNMNVKDVGGHCRFPGVVRDGLIFQGVQLFFITASLHGDQLPAAADQGEGRSSNGSGPDNEVPF